ncbi:hypothetical protein GURASL_35100 [Geotalea uraniireducens]|uniref:histidine kinase n=1 Tax=Geotalea uraniireducens TaxID=351604 RepID=A0ABM8EQR1_9BACT|nr:ATP-binding protein [Geotalea uraniireducens]BDV44587.1 hypothetical protein GURASL_35100 [Geotalea uraniireducens]
MNDQPLYSSRIIDIYLKLLRNRYPAVDVPDLLRYAGMTFAEVHDPGHWFNQVQVNRFYDRLVQFTGNEDIAREAGRYVASPEALGVLRQCFLGLVGPRHGLRLAGRAASFFTRSSVFSSRFLAANRVQIDVSFKEGVREEPYQCANRTGFIEAFVMLFTGALPQIEHPECIFRGGSVCSYIVTWRQGRADRWKYARTAVLLLGLVGLAGSAGLGPELLARTAAIGVPVMLLAMLLAERAEKKDFRAALTHLQDSTGILLDQIGENYENALLVNELGQVISRQTDVDGILANVVQVLDKRLKYDRGVIFTAAPDRTRLVFRDSFGFDDRQRSALAETEFRLDGDHARGIFATSFREQRSLLIDSPEEFAPALSPERLAMARRLEVHSFICCPIVCDGKSLGILAVDRRHTCKPLLKSDLNLMAGVTPAIGVAIHNAWQVEERLALARLIEESEEKYRTTMEASLVGIFVIQDLVYHYVNPTMAELFGYRPEELVGRLGPLDLVAAEDREEVRWKLANPAGEPTGGLCEVTGVRRDGTRFAVLAWGKGARFAGRPAVVGTLVDISDRKRAEEELQRRSRELEAANRELEAFGYSVAHDLRAPLRAINGFAAILADDQAIAFDATGRESLERIRLASARMGEMIDAILNLAKVTRGELAYETIDLSALAREIAGELRLREPARAVDFVVADGVRVQGDATLLRVVLENLLGNAWKYTGRRERGRIEFGIREGAGDGTTCFVSDNGTGFDMRYAGKLFGPFQRLHRAGEFEGTGIGLATVQRIVHRHGGRVWAEAAVDRGATFFFTL